MTRNFHRWEVDPFFSAAEEVQDSADRLESVYRTWVHATSTGEHSNDIGAIDFHWRELSTALGTSKWQLEEFERAVSLVLVEDDRYAGEDAPARHRQFIEAIRCQIMSIEKAILNSKDCQDLKKLPIVNLGQEDTDDLALFLCGSRAPESNHAGQVLKELYTDERDNQYILHVPMEVKEQVSDSFAMSISTADRALNKNESVKAGVSDWEGRGHVLKSVDRHSTQENMEDAIVSVVIDQDDRAASDPAPEHSLTDDSDGVGNSGERANGRYRSASVGSGLNTWKSGSVIRNFNKRRQQHTQVESNASFWSYLRRKKRTLELRLSKSGFKRWKDGDVDAGHSEVSKLLEGGEDLNKGIGGPWFGGSSATCGSDHRKAWGGALLTLLHAHHTFPSTRPVRIASAILVALGFVGLLSFHVTAAAI